MALFKFTNDSLLKVEETTFREENIRERQNLQGVLRDHIDAIAPGTMVLAEEFGDWVDSRRRVDLLCLDRAARLVVVELKRTEDGGHMELQAIRYAAMVSKMTFEAAIHAHKRYLEQRGIEEDAEERILQFLGWDERQEEDFANDVSIVLASAEFSKELMTTVIWLGEHDLDISCVRMKPYKLDGQTLLDIQQIFPLPEAADYQIRIRRKERSEREAREQNRDMTRFDLRIGDRLLTNLPKRRLAFNVIREAVTRGVNPRDLVDTGRHWVIVEGEHDQDSFLQEAQQDRIPGSSNAKIRRFYTADEELMVFEGNTYALTKMWGRSTIPTVDNAIQENSLSDISYKIAERYGDVE